MTSWSAERERVLAHLELGGASGAVDEMVAAIRSGASPADAAAGYARAALAAGRHRVQAFEAACRAHGLYSAGGPLAGGVTLEQLAARAAPRSATSPPASPAAERAAHDLGAEVAEILERRYGIERRDER